MRKLFFVFCILYIVFWSVKDSIAQECGATAYDCQIAQIQREIDALSPAHQKNKDELNSLNKQINSIQTKIANLQTQLKKNAENIKLRERDLKFTTSVFEEKTLSHYKFIRLYDPIMPFLSSNNALQTFKEITIRQKTIDEDRKQLETYALDLKSLNRDKETLEKNTKSLATLQNTISDRAKFLEAEVKKVDSYLTQLSSRQTELQALKAGGFSTSVGDTPGTLEPCSGPPGSSNYCDPGFKPAFAGFSFGAPHRTGMSQYGAFGRAKSGQNAESILSAYYQGSSLNKSYASPSTIGVSGIGRVSFEENYLLGIYEIPESWGDQGGYEALKAQAVAARSYALAVTNNGAGNICTTEACQVYKPQLKSGKWAQAVRDTKGWVLLKDGSPAKTFFASTSGGFTITQWGWSGIKDASGDWPGTAYEKVGGSPWFYKGWYKSRANATCGRNNPWLTSSDMADILNAWSVIKNGNGDLSRISPVGNCWNGNPYSMDELKNIGGYSSVSNASVVYNNSGYTQTVNFDTNKGSVSISGDELKKAFNLRAPGYLGIKSSLFNIEVVK